MLHIPTYLFVLNLLRAEVVDVRRVLRFRRWTPESGSGDCVLDRVDRVVPAVEVLVHSGDGGGW